MPSPNATAVTAAFRPSPDTRLKRQWPDRETGRAELYLVLVGLCLCVGDVKYSSTVAHSAILCKHFLFNMNTVRGSFTAKTLVRAKNDGLTPVALRAKRPLIAPSRPSSSRLDRLEPSFWRRKVGRGRAHDRAPGVSAPAFLQELRLCGHFPRILQVRSCACASSRDTSAGGSRKEKLRRATGSVRLAERGREGASGDPIRVGPGPL